MANAWITHVKAFAQQHNMRYGDALKHPQCKTSYHSGKQRINGGAYMPPTPPRDSNGNQTYQPLKSYGRGQVARKRYITKDGVELYYS